MAQTKTDRRKETGLVEVKKILHEILDEPGPPFSFYCISEDDKNNCIICEIHCNGKEKHLIKVTEDELLKCTTSEDGRNWMKGHLRNAMEKLINNDDW